jgi:nucleoside phosphorylase
MRYAAAVAVSLLLAVTGMPPAGAASDRPAPASVSCASTQVLLLGSYPAEVAQNVDLLVPDGAQPTVVGGHAFYVGTLDGKRVVIGVAGQSHAAVAATTTLALQHFTCISAVVFTGTAGGDEPAGLGDVAVPDRWTGNEGATYVPVDARALAYAREVAADVTAHLATLAAIEDGPCPGTDPSGAVTAITVIPIARTPRLVVGGKGVTYGDGSACTAGGGLLEGCDPCPPTSGTGGTTVTVVSALTPTEAAAAAQAGTLATGLTALSPIAPPNLPGNVGNSSTSYLADDEQTTAAQAVADTHHVPFLAFRGISDTRSVGDLWPGEYAVFQGLAANNADTAARIWLHVWTPAAATDARVATVPVRTQVRNAPVPAAGSAGVDGSLAMTGSSPAVAWLALLACGTGGAALVARRRHGARR